MGSENATLVVGCGATLLDGLQDVLPDGSVVVIEEPELIETQRGGVRERAAQLPVVAQLIPAEYVHGNDPAEVIAALPSGREFSRVIPATDELSVVGAAAIAAQLGLPGGGVRAARTFRDKIELRQAAAAAGLTNPRWREVAGLDDLRGAVAEFGPRDLVLKPAARSGSQGVLLLGPGDDLAQAWQQSTTAPGKARMKQPPATRYLVEERLHGPEVSVECLVAYGDIVFVNVTSKRVLPGRHPVETGHVLPAAIDAETEKELAVAMQVLVGATGYGFGVLHGEWILTEGGPALVECAARIPGDEICRLISLAYDMPFIPRYAELMTGDRDAVRAVSLMTSTRAAAITFLTPAPGTVTEITGVAAAQTAPGVELVEIETAAGAVVAPLHASRDRAGHVIAVGADAALARARADQAASLIDIRSG
jgi:biotin carboxylase